MKTFTLFPAVLFGLVLLASTNIFARNNPKDNILLGFANYSRGTPQSALFNMNNISSWQYYDGRSGTDPNGNSGIIYPRATAGVIFQDGLIWGGLLIILFMWADRHSELGLWLAALSHPVLEKILIYRM